MGMIVQPYSQRCFLLRGEGWISEFSDHARENWRFEPRRILGLTADDFNFYIYITFVINSINTH